MTEREMMDHIYKMEEVARFGITARLIHRPIKKLGDRQGEEGVRPNHS